MQKLDFYDIIHVVDEETNISDNNSSPEVLGAVVRRRPGRPKGLPKPAGSGRQLGTPNRVGKEARDLASKYTVKAFRRLATMLDSKDEKAVAIAAREILDRAFGRPVSPSEVSGPNGTPLHPAPLMSDTELARFMCFTLAKGAAEAGETLYEPPMRAAKAVEMQPADPFATVRAEQAARIEAARTNETNETVGETQLGGYAEAVAAQKAEDEQARAEGRSSRPAPIWVAPSGSRQEHGLEPPRHNVVRFKPGRR